MNLNFNPKHCILEVSHNCNLKCLTCILWTKEYNDYKDVKTNLSVEEIIRLQKSLQEYGIKKITYLGGEPFLNKELLLIAKEAKSCGLNTAVVTNGTLINDEISEDIVRNKAFDIIIFSIDGTSLIHDKIRGFEGTFLKATEAIRLLQRKRKRLKQKTPEVYLYVTLSSVNCGQIEQLAELARKLDVHAIKFITASFLSGEIVKNTNKLFLQPAIRLHTYMAEPSIRISKVELSDIRKRLLILKEKTKKTGLRFFFEEILTNGFGSNQCRFLGSDFIISYEGGVSLCPMLPEYTLGNTREATVSDILQKGSTKDRINYLFNLCSQKVLPVCSECCVEKMH